MTRSRHAHNRTIICIGWKDRAWKRHTHMCHVNDKTAISMKYNQKINRKEHGNCQRTCSYYNIASMRHTIVSIIHSRYSHLFTVLSLQRANHFCQVPTRNVTSFHFSSTNGIKKIYNELIRCVWWFAGTLIAGINGYRARVCARVCH